MDDETTRSRCHSGAGNVLCRFPLPTGVPPPAPANRHLDPRAAASRYFFATFVTTLRGSTTCVTARPELTDRVLESLERVGITGHSLKGGDPAAPSGTATLLRLHPPHRAHLRHLRPLRVRPATSGAPDSGGVTGGVYKAREHIHRSVLTCGY